MSVLAYSELMKRIVGVDETKLETPFKILNNNNTTKTRLKILKELAKQDKATIGKLLKNSGHNRTGGSYITIKNYFLDLEKDGLLKKEKRGTIEEWSFSEKYEDIKVFIQ